MKDSLLETTFIDENRIWRDIEEANPEPGYIKTLIQKAKTLIGLSPKETASLLAVKDKDLTLEIFDAARVIKERVYGKRIVLFAPLYLSNECENNCLYCGFRIDNKELERKTLSLEEVKSEVLALEEIGHRRVLLVAGENLKKVSIEYIEKVVDIIYMTKIDGKDIRRVHINIAPLDVEGFRRLKEAKIGVYQLFQETYSSSLYEKVHPKGRKADYLWRLSAMDRAHQAGLGDLGIGVLFGLYDFRFEVLALLYHSMHLEELYGSGPHTISVPRIEPALNAPISLNPPSPVSDEDFKKLVAVLRLAVPYTGIILTTRERTALRNELISLGVSQISAGSRTHPGGYREGLSNKREAQQFSLYDTRGLDETVRYIIKIGLIPSFCTACYRSGRVGEAFMEFAKPGEIQNFCKFNALLTLKEYLLDHASPATKSLGEELLKREIEGIKDLQRKEGLKKALREIEKGERDIFI